MVGPLTTGELLAALALLLSVYATGMTIRFNSRQKSLIKSQELLNKRLLAREDDQARADKQADLGADFVKLGGSDWRLKVFNKGKAAARNVNLSFPEGNHCFSQADIDSKFPLEILEPMQSVQLLAAIDFESASKHPIRLAWADGLSETNAKTVYPTL
jgi:hypothetical protein